MLVFLVWKVNQMRSRNSTQKHTSVKNGRRLQKSSTFLKRQRLKNLRSSTRGFSSVWTDDDIFSQTISSPSSDEEEVDVPADTNITAAQAKGAVHIMFMECSENVEKEDFAAIFWVDKLSRKVI
ncbi:hypothetical protein AVEN_102818-1 [Araneus ventricosus]|uniref:Uncharacterized protein n=1 Tax=Araneus ventricosus TaxID=182803 RepID=A0A4Y2WUR4_ARAVE|nr:hypothetical protein AVEN_102818-1 [Araneus ventricosus]